MLNAAFPTSVAKHSRAVALINGVSLGGILEAKVVNDNLLQPDQWDAAFPTSVAKHSRAVALINGVSLGGILEAKVVNDNLLQPDQWGLWLDVNQLPAQYNADYWSTTQDQVIIDIYLGYQSHGGPADVTQLGPAVMTGIVEHCDIDPIDGIMELSGHDLGQLLVDAKTSEKFANQSASQVVQTLAARHGLTANVSTDEEPAGVYYGADQARLASQHSEWEVLALLAQVTKSDVWVSGRTLNFQPSAVPGVSKPWIAELPPLKRQRAEQIKGNILLHRVTRISRKFLIAPTVEVTVKSWHSQHKKVYSHTARSAPKSVMGNAKARKYSFGIAGLNDAQVKGRAGQIADDITRHEKTIDTAQPGDNRLTAQTLLSVQGTGTQWDQIYYIAAVERHLTTKDGYTMAIRAKNTSPRDTEVEASA